MKIDQLATSVEVTVTRSGRSGFVGKIVIHLEDGTWDEYKKTWVGKSLGVVRTEIAKIKATAIDKGLDPADFKVTYL